MIWLTCAPESEKVTTARGCFIIAKVYSSFSLTSGWRKNCFRCFSKERSMNTSTEPAQMRSHASARTKRCGTL